jgi:hypothetical protein
MEKTKEKKRRTRRSMRKRKPKPDAGKEGKRKESRGGIRSCLRDPCPLLYHYFKLIAPSFMSSNAGGRGGGGVAGSQRGAHGEK